MPDRIGGLCAFLEESVPELQGDLMHYTARSGDIIMHVIMPLHAALTMARATYREYKSADLDAHAAVTLIRSAPG